jgi:hypothetical protein
VKDDTEKQFHTDTEHAVGDVENNQQGPATSRDTHFDGPENQVLESPGGDNQSGVPTASESASIVAGSEDSAPVASPSVTTQKEADEPDTDRTNILTVHREAGQPDRRKSTGPRTELGKQRSSQSALKSGIFSRATLLKGESKFEYGSLLEDLWKTFQPEGRLEEILVEKLASLIWRYRRLLVAEGAEIRKSSEFLEFDRIWQEGEQAEEISQRQQAKSAINFTLEPVGLIWQIQNVTILERCMELLFELQKRVEVGGLDENRDRSILQTIYGGANRLHLQETLYDQYSIYFRTAEVSESERKSKGYPTAEQCKEEMMRQIIAEWNYLKQQHDHNKSTESKRSEVEILRQRVPDSPGLDRLLRYESSLERAFDRTLTQLERLQRMRKGQPLPPQLDVKIS